MKIINVFVFLYNIDVVAYYVNFYSFQNDNVIDSSIWQLTSQPMLFCNSSKQWTVVDSHIQRTRAYAHPRGGWGL